MQLPTKECFSSVIQLVGIFQENDANFAVNNGNMEPHRGFGHIAVMTPDVYAASEELERSGVKFQKRPDEGRMKGLAFALDPDGYWVEIVKRSEAATINKKYTFAQTMLRVKVSELFLNCLVSRKQLLCAGGVVFLLVSKDVCLYVPPSYACTYSVHFAV